MLDLSLIPSYYLGIIWAIGSYAENNRFCFRHKNKYFLEQLQLIFGNLIYDQPSTSHGTQYVLKSSNIDLARLYEMGWNERNKDIRSLPTGLLDYKDFLRAYIEIHSGSDYSNQKTRNGVKFKSLRLRIYGNVVLINGINELLCAHAGVAMKSVQVLRNGKTAILHYASFREIENIFSYLFGYPHCPDFWSDVNIKLQNPTKDCTMERTDH